MATPARSTSKPRRTDTAGARQESHGAVRYVVEYVPAAAVAKVAEKHARAIAKGASVWDFVQPEYLTKEVGCADEKAAWSAAQRALPLDEFGEVHVFEQESVRDGDEAGSWLSWEIRRRAVVYDGDTEFTWETWR